MTPGNKRNMRHSLNMHPVLELETTFRIASRLKKLFLATKIYAKLFFHTRKKIFFFNLSRTAINTFIHQIRAAFQRFNPVQKMRRKHHDIGIPLVGSFGHDRATLPVDPASEASR